MSYPPLFSWDDPLPGPPIGQPFSFDDADWARGTLVDPRAGADAAGDPVAAATTMWQRFQAQRGDGRVKAEDLANRGMSYNRALDGSVQPVTALTGVPLAAPDSAGSLGDNSSNLADNSGNLSSGPANQPAPPFSQPSDFSLRDPNAARLAVQNSVPRPWAIPQAGASNGAPSTGTDGTSGGLAGPGTGGLTQDGQAAPSGQSGQTAGIAQTAPDGTAQSPGAVPTSSLPPPATPPPRLAPQQPPPAVPPPPAAAASSWPRNNVRPLPTPAPAWQPSFSAQPAPALDPGTGGMLATGQQPPAPPSGRIYPPPVDPYAEIADDHPGQVADALTQAVREGRIPPLSAEQLQNAQAADAKYAELVAIAGNAQVAKALVHGAGIGLVGFGGFELGAAMGVEGGPIGSAIGGIAVSTLAVIAARKGLEKLGEYNAVIASLNASAQLHPTADQAGTLAVNGPQVFRSVGNLGQSAAAAARGAAVAGASPAGAALAAARIVGTPAARAAAAGLGGQVVQQAFDSAVYVGANLLGIRVDRPPPPTLTQYLQAAALGVLTAGGSEKFGNAPTDRIASLMIRGQIREQCGVPLGSAESVHTAQVAEHLAAQGVAGDPQRLAMLTAPLTAEEEAAYRELAPRVAQIRASGKMPPPQSAAPVSDDGRMHGDFTAYGGSGAASPSGPAGSGAKAPNAPGLTVTGPDGFVAASAPPPGGSARDGSSPSGGGPDSPNPAHPSIPGLDTDLPSAAAPAKGGSESPAEPPIPGLDTDLPSAAAPAKGGTESPADPPIPGLDTALPSAAAPAKNGAEPPAKPPIPGLDTAPTSAAAPAKGGSGSAAAAGTSARPGAPVASWPPLDSGVPGDWGRLDQSHIGQEIETLLGKRGTLVSVTPRAVIYHLPGKPEQLYYVTPKQAHLAPPDLPNSGAAPASSGQPPADQPEPQARAGGDPSAPADEEETYPLTPYVPGGGHHIPMKIMFKGHPKYDEDDMAVCISKAYLDRLGVDHDAISKVQQNLYRAYGKTGKPLTWEAIQDIETQALIEGKGDPTISAATVRKVIGSLKATGVSPTRTPWGK